MYLLLSLMLILLFSDAFLLSFSISLIITLSVAVYSVASSPSLSLSRSLPRLLSVAVLLFCSLVVRADRRTKAILWGFKVAADFRSDIVEEDSHKLAVG